MEVYNYVVVAGVLIGVFARTVFPYILKLSTGDAQFEWKFLRSAAVGAAMGVFAGGAAIPMVAPDTAWPAALWLGITTGYSLQSAARHVEKVMEKRNG